MIAKKQDAKIGYGYIYIIQVRRWSIWMFLLTEVKKRYKTKVLSPRASITVADFDYHVEALLNYLIF